MLPRSARLSRESFGASFKRAKRKHLPYGQVLFAPAPDFRAAVVIGKKVEPTAVGRHRFRRRLYAVFGTLRKDGLHGHFVFIASSGLKRASFAEVAAGLRAAVLAF